MREPAIFCSNNDGLFAISTKLKRASKRSERLRTKRGQYSAPGISSCKFDIIWQPLQTPKDKVSGRLKNAANSSRTLLLNKIDFAQPSPAPNTSP